MVNRPAYYRQRKEQGLCRECNQPRVVDRILCVQHQILWAARAKQLRIRRIQESRCANCGTVPSTKLIGKLCGRCQRRNNAQNVQGNHRRKRAAFDILGDKCVCCGEANMAFLVIDHVNNDGTLDRRMLGGAPTQKLHRALILHKDDIVFLSRYQTLCANCNMAKAIQRVCPHQEAFNGC